MTHILVIGAGIVGSFASMILAREGHRVTVLDRDQVGAVAPQSRQGVKQYGQTHILMPGGARILDRETPHAVRRILDAGGRSHDMLAGVWAAGTVGPRRPGDEQYETYAARRPVLEAALQGAAANTDGVTLRAGSRVRALLTGEPRVHGRPHVTGVVTDDGTRIEADLVVDASGRRTELPAMLERLGAVPQELREETGFRYYSRFFRADGRGLPVSRYWPLTHHDSVSVITAPGDGDHWSVTLVTSGRDQALRPLSDPDVWDAVLALYPEAAHWGDGVPDGDVRVMAGTGTTHRRWVSDGEPAVTGLVAIGDAHMTLNPQFGMGMTAGLGQAQTLRDVVRRTGLGDPADLVLALDADLEEQFWPIWLDGDTWNRHRLAEIDAEIRGESYSTDDPAWALRTALDTAVTLDADVVRGYGLVASQLASAEEALIKPGLVQRVVELSTGRPRYASGAPDRARLLETVGRPA
ncbi:NAD(P)/FAD-dependent oxidoreductase [Streptomyces sp. MA15]|uniref:FAD-dependent oxidoreductase n=1 Tax=Streptomyces sp. MA15 TaxID=3055061 RepID=UPI0025B11F61|nr:NAD(P)/FAD-dependent oxidoreductase [Streptomyces sp. MA15]MDN3271949.1 NAD(P)/FAD-dependent oxidoreductase [Streptomyces sp. MA15]